VGHLGYKFPYVPAQFRHYTPPGNTGKGNWYLPNTWDNSWAEGDGRLALWGYPTTKITSGPCQAGLALGSVEWVWPTRVYLGQLVYVKFVLMAAVGGVNWTNQILYYTGTIVTYVASGISFETNRWLGPASIVNDITGVPTGYVNSDAAATPWP
jgi:hypothetical protein